MKKHFNIWRNKYNHYIALFSYSNNKTSDVKDYEYLDTVLSESPKKAINMFYEQNRENITISREWLNETGDIKKDILTWAKKLREEYDNCPMNVALSLSKMLFSEKDIKKLIFKPDEIKELGLYWLNLKEYKEKLTRHDKDCLFYDFLVEPLELGLPPMFGEEVALDRHQEKLTDHISKILSFVNDEDKKTVYKSIEDIIALMENRHDF